MEKQEYHHENLREELIQTGITLLAKEGLSGLSLRKIAAACGVSHAAPYKHFKNKEEMVQAILDFVMGEFCEKLRMAASDKKFNPQERLIEMGKGYVQFMAEHTDYIKIMFIGDYMPHSHEPDCIQNAKSAYQIFRQTALDYLHTTDGIEQTLNYHIDGMWSLVHGMAVLLIQGEIQPKEDYLLWAHKVMQAMFTHH